MAVVWTQGTWLQVHFASFVIADPPYVRRFLLPRVEGRRAFVPKQPQSGRIPHITPTTTMGLRGPLFRLDHRASLTSHDSLQTFPTKIIAVPLIIQVFLSHTRIPSSPGLQFFPPVDLKQSMPGKDAQVKTDPTLRNAACEMCTYWCGNGLEGCHWAREWVPLGKGVEPEQGPKRDWCFATAICFRVYLYNFKNAKKCLTSWQHFNWIK